MSRSGRSGERVGGFSISGTEQRSTLVRCFSSSTLEIPEACVPRLREVQVGSFEEWGAESDHCPVTVSLDV